MSHDDHNEDDENEETNVEKYIWTQEDLKVRSENTLRIATDIEVLALMKERIKQLSAPEVGPLNPPMSQRVLNIVGTSADIIRMITLELSDPTVDFPVLIKRGEKYLRPHKDVYILRKSLDFSFLPDSSAGISFEDNIIASASAPSIKTDLIKKNAERIEKESAEKKIHRGALGILV